METEIRKKRKTFVKPNYLVRLVSLLVFASATLTAQVARQENAVPLKNWPAPLYWHPNPVEREGAAPQLQFSSNAVSNNALTLIAITPCRLVDTRGASAGFNGADPFAGPSITSKGTLTIPVQSAAQTSTTAPAPCGAIPSIAQAYSFNVTVVPHAGGAVDYVSLWPSNTLQPFVATLNDPQGAIVSNAAIVPAGFPSGGVNVYNDGPSTTDVIIDMNGYFTAPTDANSNTAIGANTLFSNTTGSFNTATGIDALSANTTGGDNTASGYYALGSNTTGSGNTATGLEALENSTTGGYNTATGIGALQSNTTAGYNTASGSDALRYNTTGSGNTAIGFQALEANTTGSNNIAIGLNAGYTAATGGDNIYIGNLGASGDNGVIKIGTMGVQTSTYIAGISGVSVSGAGVFVNGNGQLGIAVSSRRFKEQITDMGDTSSKLFQLRPVNFFYKPQYDDGSHELQYGLIAEEVAKVYPEMVAYDKDGQILTVKYQLLAPMLLNEVQKQAARNQSLEERVAALEALLAGQTATAAQPASDQ